MGTEKFMSEAFEQGFVIGLLSFLLVVAGIVIWQLFKKINSLQDSKQEILKESLGLIKLVETQLTENKSTNQIVSDNSNLILSELKLIKQILEQNK